VLAEVWAGLHEAVAKNTVGREQFVERLRNMLAENKGYRSIQPTASASLEEHPNDDAKPRELLTGWRQITAALGMKYSERASVRSLNVRLAGPILTAGQGAQPRVYKSDLIHWWNQLAIEQQDLANRRAGARLSGETHHQYGREGVAAPEIGGGVKKRRRHRLT
jgi:hypothetical protein